MDWNERDPLNPPETEEDTLNKPEEPIEQPAEPVEQPAETVEQPEEPAEHPQFHQPVPSEQPPWYSTPQFNTYHIPPQNNDQQPPVFGQTPPADNGWTPPPKPVQTTNKGLRIFAGVLAAVMLLIAGICGGYLAGKHGIASDDSSTSSTTSSGGSTANGSGVGSASDFQVQTSEGSEDVYSYEQIVEKVSPSIVNITVYSPSGEAGSYASGIIMDADKGYVLTNDHIYSETVNAKFLITLNDGTEFSATFVSGDSRSDIAILKIDDPKNLVAATFSTQTLHVGERVLAIGQSYGYADTVSEGIVSAVDRRVSLTSGSYSEKYIQTTAAINPGNSGGALVNMAGQVIGVTSAKIATEDVEGLGFAIPTEQALWVVENLQKNGKVVGRAKLGITYTEVGTVLSEVNGIPTGLYIQSISSDSDLYGKGFSQGDVITHVNGETITIATDVLDVIDSSSAGDKLTLTIYQQGSGTSKTVTVTLSEAESTNSYTTAQSDTQSRTNSYNYEFDLP